MPLFALHYLKSPFSAANDALGVCSASQTALGKRFTAHYDIMSGTLLANYVD